MRLDARAAGQPVVSIRDVAVRYPGRDRDALAGVTLELWPGERVGLVGSAGSGRSTLCRLLNGIVPQLTEAAVSGRIRVAGADPRTTSVPEMARLVGMAFDDPAAQLAQSTVADEVALAMESMGMAREVMAGRMDEVLARLGLELVRDRPPRALSGGQQQRVLLASALALRPPVLVLDEATVSLDAVGRADVLDLLADLASSERTAVVVVEHDTELLAAWADRIVVLLDGRVAADGPPVEVLGDVLLLERAGVRVPDVTAIVAALHPDAVERPPVTLSDAISRLRGDG
jgi:energy-coupling factor transporter ATP-binding protein EcfA2